MVKRRRGSAGSSRGKAKNNTVLHLLEIASPKGIRQAKKISNDLSNYHWNQYSELARQRSLIQEQLQQALIQPSVCYEFANWQRAVKYKYGLHPLSTVGSLSFIGGRFNTGTGVNSEVPYFPALYLAQNKDTSLQEHLGQEPNKLLSPREVALTNAASETIVSVSGKLDKVFDLTKEAPLVSFVNLIKNFELSSDVQAFAKRLGLSASQIIKTPEVLLAALLEPNWRNCPTNYDVPSNSQIFGHLVYLSGIEGILYPSKFTGDLCLVVFPKNFVGTDSFIMLDDKPPHEKVPTKIDGITWRLTELEAKEIIC